MHITKEIERIFLYFLFSSLSSAWKGSDQMRDQGLVFVETVTKMLKRLLEYRHIIQDEIKDHRMSCIVNLLVGTIITLIFTFPGLIQQSTN